MLNIGCYEMVLFLQLGQISAGSGGRRARRCRRGRPEDIVHRSQVGQQGGGILLLCKMRPEVPDSDLT